MLDTVPEKRSQMTEYWLVTSYFARVSIKANQALVGASHSTRVSIPTTSISGPGLHADD